jgi:hypothetical protein
MKMYNIYRFPHGKENEVAARVETLAAAAICLVLVVYNRESASLHLPFLPLRWREGGGDLGPTLGVVEGSLS